MRLTKEDAKVLNKIVENTTIDVLYDMYEMQEKEKDSRDGKLKEKN